MMARTSASDVSKTPHSASDASPFREFYRPPAGALRREQYVVKQRLAMLGKPDGGDPSIGKPVALDDPIVPVGSLQSGMPSGDPKGDAAGSGDLQAISRASKANAFESRGKLRRQFGLLLRPSLTGIQILAIPFGGVTDQSVDVPYAAKMCLIGVVGWKADSSIDDPRTEAALLHQRPTQSSQHFFVC